MDKKLKKKFQPKKSVSIVELKKIAGAANTLPIRLPATEGKSSFVLNCDECGFEPPENARIRFIEDLQAKRVVCEVCFENLQISEWRFVSSSQPQ